MRSRHFFLAAGGVLLAVIGYNLYALDCGRCSCSTFWSGSALLGVAAVLLLAGIGLWLAFRPVTADFTICPGCHCRCAAGWQHCPDCGRELNRDEKGVSR